MARERLFAVVAHLHRTTRVEREQRAVDLHREILATAERAADAREVDADLLRAEVETRRDLVAIDVQPLGRHMDVDAALAVWHGEARLRPEERLVLDPDLVHAVRDDLAFGLRVAVPDHEMPDDVRAGIVQVPVAHRGAVGMERLLLERPLHVDDRLERLVLDLDRRQRPPRLLGMVGGDDGDRLAHVAHPVAREDGLIRELEAVRLPAGNVGIGEDRLHARECEGLRKVDRDDPRVRVRASQRVAPEHPRRGEVARVVELPRHLRHGVVAQQTLADLADAQCRAWRGDAHRRSAARCTASKIFA
jgi:hypothetical protein